MLHTMHAMNRVQSCMPRTAPDSARSLLSCSLEEVFRPPQSRVLGAALQAASLEINVDEAVRHIVALDPAANGGSNSSSKSVVRGR